MAPKFWSGPQIYNLYIFRYNLQCFEFLELWYYGESDVFQNKEKNIGNLQRLALLIS